MKEIGSILISCWISGLNHWFRGVGKKKKKKTFPAMHVLTALTLPSSMEKCVTAKLRWSIIPACAEWQQSFNTPSCWQSLRTCQLHAGNLLSDTQLMVSEPSSQVFYKNFCTLILTTVCMELAQWTFKKLLLSFLPYGRINDLHHTFIDALANVHQRSSPFAHFTK